MKKSMEHSKNCIFLVLISAVAFMLPACGESDDSVGADQKAVDADMEVNAYEDLPSCVEKRYGKVAFVVKQERSYICLNSGWNVYDVVQTSFTDSRDGNTYKAVAIGTQIWMAENLKYQTKKSNCFNDDSETCSEFGRFYSWAAAMDSVGEFSAKGKRCGYGSKCSPSGKVRGICPEGWHLPSKAEFDTLLAVVGGQSTAGQMLKSAISSWNNCNGCLDSYFFSASPVGYYYKGDFKMKDDEAYFWTSTEFHCSSKKDCTSQYDSLYAYYMKLSDYDDYEYAYLYNGNKSYRYSIRCVKDEPSKSKSSINETPKSSSSKKTSSSESSSNVTLGENIGPVTDTRDGKTYRTVIIGSQVWMAENLNYESKNSLCYGNSLESCSQYGRLYTWSDAKEVCPLGWHLPSKIEFDTLFFNVGGRATAGRVLKSTSGWFDYDWECRKENFCVLGLDAYGFSVLPSRFMEPEKSVFYYNPYNNNQNGAFFWTSTKYDSCDVYSVDIDDGAGAGFSHRFRDLFYSVRCVYDKLVERRDTPVSLSGTIGSLSDPRDNKVYKTVTIGSQVWMAENLNYKTKNSSCYEDGPDHCTNYGRLYTWEAAKDACPLGWHLPSKNELDTLINAVGGQLMASRMLKSTRMGNEEFSNTISEIERMDIRSYGEKAFDYLEANYTVEKAYQIIQRRMK